MKNNKLRRTKWTSALIPDSQKFYLDATADNGARFIFPYPDSSVVWVQGCLLFVDRVFGMFFNELNANLSFNLWNGAKHRNIFPNVLKMGASFGIFSPSLKLLDVVEEESTVTLRPKIIQKLTTACKFFCQATQLLMGVVWCIVDGSFRIRWLPVDLQVPYARWILHCYVACWGNRCVGFTDKRTNAVHISSLKHCLFLVSVWRPRQIVNIQLM